MLETALTALASNGPLALLAGMIVIVLWRKLTSLQVHYEGDPKDPTKIGLVRTMQQAAQAREDALREHYEKRIDKERDGQQAVMDDLLSTLREE
jgi:hypothetical protein